MTCCHKKLLSCFQLSKAHKSAKKWDFFAMNGYRAISKNLFCKQTADLINKKFKQTRFINFFLNVKVKQTSLENLSKFETKLFEIFTFFLMKCKQETQQLSMVNHIFCIPIQVPKFLEKFHFLWCGSGRSSPTTSVKSGQVILALLKKI